MSHTRCINNVYGRACHWHFNICCYNKVYKKGQRISCHTAKCNMLRYRKLYGCAVAILSAILEFFIRFVSNFYN